MKDEPNEITEMWREVRRDKQERGASNLALRTIEILNLKTHGFLVAELTPYQFRVNGRLDLFPVHRRWHDIKTNKRGSYRIPYGLCTSVLGTPTSRGL